MNEPVERATALRGDAPHRIGVLVVPDSVPLEVLVSQSVFGPPIPAVADVMGISRQLPYEVVLVGERPRFVLARGVDVGPLAPLDSLQDCDTVIVPGVAEPLVERSAELLDALRKAAVTGARMVSFCGGAFILGQAGVLDGRTVTTHWLLEPEFRARFPHISLDVGKLYIDDPPVHTSGGIMAATDLAIHLIALDRGQAVANDVARVLVSAPQRDGGQAQFVKDQLRSDGRSSVDGLLRWVRDHLHEPITLADLARHEHLSERSLVRAFRAEVGMTALQWITRERINRAKVLLETTDFPVGDIAVMVGFGSRETLRRNFERIAGTTAGGYRRMFRDRSADVAGRIA
ncbi:helix-turn-helix domain-containing protein [Mycobacterium yunnanensis]|uniref:Helix-turn-helix domain-containing protein n=1 Tax=Mycobacterium yunnanensis TaxID=368477 RepID=A0A9X3C3H6_9MYCO|nr:helix-turn-helix domain-containing protein [Mycobacterium yunnanensis]MCV7422107.1 helix-turn-helix domain-containing protein [Mycobacterium yunnanensis]